MLVGLFGDATPVSEACGRACRVAEGTFRDTFGAPGSCKALERHLAWADRILST